MNGFGFFELGLPGRFFTLDRFQAFGYLLGVWGRACFGFGSFRGQDRNGND